MIIKKGNKVYEFMEEYMNGLKYLIKTRNSIIDKNEATAFIQLFDLPSNGQNDVERKRYKLIRDLYFIAVGFYRVEQSGIFKNGGRRGSFWQW